MNAEDARVVPAVASQAEAIARADRRDRRTAARGGRLVYAGAGTSGRLGRARRHRMPADLQRSARPGGRRHRRRSRGADPGRRRRRGPPRVRASAISTPWIWPPATCWSASPPAAARRTSSARWRYARQVGRLHDRPRLQRRRGTDSRTSIWPSSRWSGPEVLSGSTRLKAGTAHQAGPEHAHDRSDGSPRQDLRQPDGGSAGDEYQVEGAARCGSCAR